MLQSNGALRVRIPPKLLPLWTANAPKRFVGLEGGRGSGKSHGIAERLVVEATNDHIRAACMREIQVSIKDSVKQLLEDKIHVHGLTSLFKITDREIVCPSTDSLFIFRGLQNHTASSIKSLEGFNRAWYEESQSLSQRSLDLATPTFRSGAQQLFSWNPEEATDPVDVFFHENIGDPDFLHIIMNYVDNPWWEQSGLVNDMERDKRRDMDKYLHVWMGKYRKNSEARVFKNVRSFHFDTPSDAMFQVGGDWGFSIDPTTLIRVFTGRLINGEAIYDPDGRTLFIDHELYQVGLEINDTPKAFDRLVPGDPQWARRWQIRADSARPETISYMQKHGYPLMVPATKGPNSVIEGIKFLQDFDIVIHPRCVHTVDEFSFFSYKVDKKTKKITNELEEKKNHVIDAVRYAVEELRKIGFTWYVGG